MIKKIMSKKGMCSYYCYHFCNVHEGFISVYVTLPDPINVPFSLSLHLSGSGFLPDEVSKSTFLMFDLLENMPTKISLFSLNFYPSTDDALDQRFDFMSTLCRRHCISTWSSESSTPAHILPFAMMPIIHWSTWDINPELFYELLGQLRDRGKTKLQLPTDTHKAQLHLANKKGIVGTGINSEPVVSSPPRWAHWFW